MWGLMMYHYLLFFYETIKILIVEDEAMVAED